MGTFVITAELAEFLDSGVSILLGTRDKDLRPTCMRAMGAAVEAGTRVVTLFVPEATGAQSLTDIAESGQVAVTFSRVTDYRSVQLKGRVRETRPLTSAESAIQDRYRAAFVEQLYAVGVSRAVTRRIAWAPARAVVFEIDEVYEQTPGPRAGKELAS